METLTQTPGFSRKHSSASGCRIPVWPPSLNPHPTQSAMLSRCRHSCSSCGTPACRSVSAAEWKLCRTVVIHWHRLRRWLNAGQHNPREEDGYWPCFKEQLKKHLFFSPLGYMWVTWEQWKKKKRENLFFLKAHFAGYWELNWSWTGHRNEVYLRYTFLRNAAFKADIGQSDFLSRD